MEDFLPLEKSFAADGENEKNKIEKGMLYLVATPIGNLADLSSRALKVLSGVDFIAAEDTRNSGRLLNAFGIKVPLVSYFEHNKAERGPQIVRRLKEGQSCALVTDAGTPAISDPGADLVSLCVRENVPVTSVPGCCAAIDALILSGLDTRRFVFEGFLEGSGSAKKERLNELKGEKRTLILYESPHDLKDTLSLLLAVFGDRRIALCRELTKINEEIMRTTVSGAISYYREQNTRGEYVLIIEGAHNEGAFWQTMTVREHVEYYISLGMAKMDAIKEAAKDRGVGKNAIYKEMID